MPAELVVQGRVVRLRPSGTRGEIIVERVLLGHLRAKRITFTGHGGVEKTHNVFDLEAPLGRPQGPFRLIYSERIASASDADAVGRALLDATVLGTPFIFVGQVVGSATKDRLLHVKVLRYLQGKLSPVGSVVPLKLNGCRLTPSKRKPLASATRHAIYLVATAEPGRDVPGPLVVQLPLEMEGTVTAAVARRPHYPIYDRVWGVPPQKFRLREIIYRGGIDQAFALLESSSVRARCLGVRTLIHRRREARGRLVRKIRQGLFLATDSTGDAFSRLGMLIELLHAQERFRWTGAINDLVDHVIVRLESDAPAPSLKPRVRRKPRIFRGPGWTLGRWTRLHEIQYDDTNHALSWLLWELKPSLVRRGHMERLLKLRRTLQHPRWRHEVELALSASRVESHRELQEAFRRARRLVARPLDMTSCKEAAVLNGVVFSKDGKVLLGYDNHRLICRWPLPGSAGSGPQTLRPAKETISRSIWSPVLGTDFTRKYRLTGAKSVRLSATGRWMVVKSGLGGVSLRDWFDRRTPIPFTRISVHGTLHSTAVLALEERDGKWEMIDGHISPDGRLLAVLSESWKSRRVTLYRISPELLQLK